MKSQTFKIDYGSISTEQRLNYDVRDEQFYELWKFMRYKKVHKRGYSDLLHEWAQSSYSVSSFIALYGLFNISFFTPDEYSIFLTDEWIVYK